MCPQVGSMSVLWFDKFLSLYASHLTASEQEYFFALYICIQYFENEGVTMKQRGSWVFSLGSTDFVDN
jgi:hypothetical protein